MTSFLAGGSRPSGGGFLEGVLRLSPGRPRAAAAPADGAACRPGVEPGDRPYFCRAAAPRSPTPPEPSLAACVRRLQESCDPQQWDGETLTAGGLFGTLVAFKGMLVISNMVPGLIISTGAVSMGVNLWRRSRPDVAPPPPTDKLGWPRPRLSNRQVACLAAAGLGVGLLVQPRPDVALHYFIYAACAVSAACKYSDRRTAATLGASIVVAGSAWVVMACAAAPALGGSFCAAAAAIAARFVVFAALDHAGDLLVLGRRKLGFDNVGLEGWLQQMS